MKEIDDIKNVIKVLDESHEKISNYAKTKKAYKKVGWGSFFHKGWIIDTLMFLAFVGSAIGFCVSPLMSASMLALSLMIVPVVGAMSIMISKAIRILIQSKFNDNQEEEGCVQKLLDISNEMENTSMLLEHKYKDLLNLKDGFTYKDLKEYRKCVDDIKYHCGENLNELIRPIQTNSETLLDGSQDIWKGAKQVVMPQISNVMKATVKCSESIKKYKDIELTNLNEEKLCQKLPLFTTEKFEKQTNEIKKEVTQKYIQNSKERTEELDR